MRVTDISVMYERKHPTVKWGSVGARVEISASADDLDNPQIVDPKRAIAELFDLAKGGVREQILSALPKTRRAAEAASETGGDEDVYEELHVEVLEEGDDA